MTSGRGVPEYKGPLSGRSELSLLINRLEQILLPGKVVQIDYDACYARVAMLDQKNNGITTDWIRWTEDTAGDDREWSPPSVGENVLVFSPTGSVNNGIIHSAFNTTDFPALSNSRTIRRKTWGKPPKGSFFDSPFWELEKQKGSEHVWNYLPTSGEFRHEIGDKVLIHWTSEFLMFRIGNTQFVLKDGSAVTTIADDLTDPTESTEINATLHDVTIRTNNEASVRVIRPGGQNTEYAAVEIQVSDKAAITVKEDSIKATVNQDACLSLANGEAQLESKTAKAILTLNSSTASLTLGAISCTLAEGVMLLGSSGTQVQIISPEGSPGIVNINSAGFFAPTPDPEPSLAPALPLIYQQGELPANPRPPVEATPQQAKPRWPMTEGKGPYYPRTNTPKR